MPGQRKQGRPVHRHHEPVQWFYRWHTHVPRGRRHGRPHRVRRQNRRLCGHSGRHIAVIGPVLQQFGRRAVPAVSGSVTGRRAVHHRHAAGGRQQRAACRQRRSQRRTRMRGAVHLECGAGLSCRYRPASPGQARLGAALTGFAQAPHAAVGFRLRLQRPRDTAAVSQVRPWLISSAKRCRPGKKSATTPSAGCLARFRLVVKAATSWPSRLRTGTANAHTPSS